MGDSATDRLLAAALVSHATSDQIFNNLSDLLARSALRIRERIDLIDALLRSQDRADGVLMESLDSLEQVAASLDDLGKIVKGARAPAPGRQCAI